MMNKVVKLIILIEVEDSVDHVELKDTAWHALDTFDINVHYVSSIELDGQGDEIIKDNSDE